MRARRSGACITPGCSTGCASTSRARSPTTSSSPSAPDRPADDDRLAQAVIDTTPTVPVVLATVERAAGRQDADLRRQRREATGAQPGNATVIADQDGIFRHVWHSEQRPHDVRGRRRPSRRSSAASPAPPTPARASGSTSPAGPGRIAQLLVQQGDERRGPGERDPRQGRGRRRHRLDVPGRPPGGDLRTPADERAGAPGQRDPVAHARLAAEGAGGHRLGAVDRAVVPGRRGRAAARAERAAATGCARRCWAPRSRSACSRRSSPACSLAFKAGWILPATYAVFGFVASAFTASSMALARTRSRGRAQPLQPLRPRAGGRRGDGDVRARSGSSRPRSTRRSCSSTCAGSRPTPSTARARETIETLNQYLTIMSEGLLGTARPSSPTWATGSWPCSARRCAQDDHADRALEAARELVGPRLEAFNDWLRRARRPTGPR